jgi:hypothetical protein
MSKSILPKSMDMTMAAQRGSERTGADFHGIGAHLTVIDCRSAAQDTHHILGLDGGAPSAEIVCCNRRCLFCVMHPVLFNSMNDCIDRAIQGVTAGSLYHFLIAVVILLGGERVRRRSGRPYIRIRGRRHIQVAAVNVHVYILELEGGIIGCCACILPRTQEEEEGNNNHIHDSPLSGGATHVIRLLHHISDDQYGNRFDS